MDASNRRLSVQQIRKLLYLASLPPGDCIRQSPTTQGLAIAPREPLRLASFATWQLHSTIPNHAGLGNCAAKISSLASFAAWRLYLTLPQAGNGAGETIASVSCFTGPIFAFAGFVCALQRLACPHCPTQDSGRPARCRGVWEKARKATALPAAVAASNFYRAKTTSGNATRPRKPP